MNLLSDILTYIRRIIKAPSNAVVSDNLLIDYVNRFWIMDVSARVQLYDLKTSYVFQTLPGVNQYNMPLYSVQTQPGNQPIAPFPVYQGFVGPCAINGIQVPLYTDRNGFWNLWPNYVQPLTDVATGDGMTTSFTFSLPFFPAIPGHVDMTGIIANINAGNNNQDPYFTTSFPLNSDNTTIAIPTTSVYPGVTIVYTDTDGNNVTVTDSGFFLSGSNGGNLYGLLMQQGSAPFGNTPLGGNSYSTTNCTVNYNSGVVNVTFSSPPPVGAQIQAQCFFFEPGIPRAILNYDNCLSFFPPPNTQYRVELQGYLTPAAFLSTGSAIPFGYMAEYIARGAARKILADTGDMEQFMFYEPLFKEQEILVWKRSQRTVTSNRTGTIFSENQGGANNNNIGQGSS